MKTNDGGPAFPHLHETCQRVNETEHHSGLSIRDYFAAAAIMSPLMTCDTVLRVTAEGGVKPMVALASMAYELADALLREREKPEEVA